MKRFVFLPVLLVLLAIVFLMVGLLGCSEDRDSQNLQDVANQEIEQVIRATLDAKYKALVSGDMQKLQSDLGRLYGDSGLVKQVLHIEANTRGLLIRHGIFCKAVDGKLTFSYDENEFSS